MQIEIKRRLSTEVVFSLACENNSIAITLAVAVSEKADLRNADLENENFYKADLRKADLRNADLRFANFRKADLRFADLRNVNLRNADLENASFDNVNLRNADLENACLKNADLKNADLRNANLRNADLRNADLCNADLENACLENANLRNADLHTTNLYGASIVNGVKLVGYRSYFVIGPIGSRKDVLTTFLTEKGVFIRTGCFFGALEEFKNALQETHGDNTHAREYLAALVLVEAHYAAWPATVPE